MPAWLIIGCSTGFGRELASEVLARGWNAAVTARDPAAVSDLVLGHDRRALPLDVMQPTQIANAVRETAAQFGAIDVLVNNAGYGYRGAVEEADEHDIRQLFETNFFGLVAVTRAVLPGMRARGRGTIVNISSVGGRMAQPGSGYHSATKFAVEGLSDALRKEVRPLGLHVMVVEPGGFRTDFAGRPVARSKPTRVQRMRAARRISPHTTISRAIQFVQRKRSSLLCRRRRHRFACSAARPFSAFAPSWTRSAVKSMPGRKRQLGRIIPRHDWQHHEP
jgi:NAD(P)-dependent dehydrogenase (short-subunit alcohol dehydrogenase family)